LISDVALSKRTPCDQSETVSGFGHRVLASRCFRSSISESAIAAGVAYVGFLLLLRHGADERRPAGPLFDATAAATIATAIAAGALGDTRIGLTWPAAAWLLSLALGPQVVGWLLITVSPPRLPAATTSLLLMIQPVGSLLPAAVIFSERPNSLQLVGVGIVLVAVLFAARWQPRPSF
jgi:drug/metabolite transporter (DMT)-like permease